MNPALSKKNEIDGIRKGGVNRLPAWFKQEIPDTATLKIKHLFSEFNVNTVCQEARCPNWATCFKQKKATFMILGNICTRNCSFCGVNKSGRPRTVLDTDEPSRIKQLVKILGLNYVVITSVTRDDLVDGGAVQFSRVIEAVRTINRAIKIEVLIPDFGGKVCSLRCVLDSLPDVVAHNVETVPRLYCDLRPLADYQLSLDILSKIKECKPFLTTKSSLMLGLGETEEEVVGTMQDLRKNYCDILTLGQYLAPSAGHYPVKEFISPGQFRKYQDTGISLGFKAILSGPLVRSSYRAEELHKEFLYA